MMYPNVKKVLELLPVSYELYRMARRALNQEEKRQLLCILQCGRKFYFGEIPYGSDQLGKNWVLERLVSETMNVYYPWRTNLEEFRLLVLKPLFENFEAWFILEKN